MTEAEPGDAVATTGEDDAPQDAGIAFGEWLAKHKGGALAREIGEAMTELGNRVHDTGRKGTVTITLGITSMPKVPGAVQVSDKVTAKLPEHSRSDAVYFHAGDGVGLASHPPDQYRFPADLGFGDR